MFNFGENTVSGFTPPPLCYNESWPTHGPPTAAAMHAPGGKQAEERNLR